MNHHQNPRLSASSKSFETAEPTPLPPAPWAPWLLRTRFSLVALRFSVRSCCYCSVVAGMASEHPSLEERRVDDPSDAGRHVDVRAFLPERQACSYPERQGQGLGHQHLSLQGDFGLVYIYIYVCMYVYIHTCIYIYIYIYTFMYIYTYIYIYTHIFNVCIYIYIYIYVYLFACFYSFLNNPAIETIGRLRPLSLLWLPEVGGEKC